MVYAGSIGREAVSLGVSGRLKDRNLIMWDAESNSLWSQITGQALYGKRKGETLPMLPAVFVSLDTWTRLHPDSAVLDLSTVRAKSWYYSSKDLARGSVRGRRGSQALGIGLRHGKDRLLIPLSKLHTAGHLAVEVGGLPLVVVWHAGESAALVYDRRLDGAVLDLELEAGELLAAGQHFDALSGESLAANSDARLQRFPYLPTYLHAWRTYYPKGRVLED